MPILGALLAAAARGLMVLLIRYIGPLLVQALIFFGLQFFTQTYAMQPFIQFIEGVLGGAPAMTVKALAAINVSKAITIILSAHVAVASARFLFRRTPTAPPAGGGK